MFFYYQDKPFYFNWNITCRVIEAALARLPLATCLVIFRANAALHRLCKTRASKDEKSLFKAVFLKWFAEICESYSYYRNHLEQSPEQLTMKNEYRQRILANKTAISLLPLLPSASQSGSKKYDLAVFCLEPEHLCLNCNWNCGTLEWPDLNRSFENVILDCSRVQCVDSTGLGGIIRLSKNLEKDGGTLYVSGCSSNLQHVFLSIGLHKAFPIFFSLSEALDFLGISSESQDAQLGF